MDEQIEMFDLPPTTPPLRGLEHICQTLGTVLVQFEATLKAARAACER